MILISESIYLLKGWIQVLNLLFTQTVIPFKSRPVFGFLHQRLCTCHQQITLRELERTIATDRQGKDVTRCRGRGGRVFARVLVIFLAKAGAGGDKCRGGRVFARVLVVSLAKAGAGGDRGRGGRVFARMLVPRAAAGGD